MGREKTVLEYENDIRQAHRDLESYKESLKAKTKPTDSDKRELEKRKNHLYTMLSAWEKKLTKTIYRASNEQLGWTETELGIEVKPMQTKKVSGYNQTGDYICHIKGGSVDSYCGILIERKGGRKGMEDLYGTLSSKENRENLYEEIDRFFQDPRFSLMVIITECTMQAYFDFAPAFIGKRKNTGHLGMSREAREATIAALFTKGIPVMFAGTRRKAIDMYLHLIRQWILKNYERLLGIEKTVSNKPI